MKKVIIPIIFTIGLSWAFLASAHQPRLVETGQIIIIKNPEVSQAFYGELRGSPQFFEIKTDRKISLYVGVLVPDLPGIKKDISAQVFSVGGEEIFVLDGLQGEWKVFFEEFAGDNYWQGPDKKMDVNPDTYRIKVYSPDNLGKYVLVVGEKESFPASEMLKTLLTLPKLKKNFFNKSPLTAFFNLIGLYLLIALVIILLIGSLIILIIKKRIKNRKESK